MDAFEIQFILIKYYDKKKLIRTETTMAISYQIYFVRLTGFK